MRLLRCVVVLTMAVLLPNVGRAQVYQVRTPPPPVTAQSADWQIASEPVIVSGLIYYPTRETRFFDGGIMSQIGVYRSVPVYADVTLEPNSVIYVPVGRSLMRGYERRREGELAGTTGSRVSAFPVDIATPNAEPRELPLPTSAGAVATRGSSASSASAGAAVPAGTTGPSIPKPARTGVESVPQPRSNDGIWLEYAGARWYSDGPSQVFNADRFVQIGNYRGFPVYRDRNRGVEEIWVRVVAEGPVAPYTRR
jgi:hypothetical protein